MLMKELITNNWTGCRSKSCVETYSWSGQMCCSGSRIIHRSTSILSRLPGDLS